MEADNSKIDAKINIRNYCVNHFKHLANKIYKLLLKANKESKTYTDIADALKHEILNLGTVFCQQIGTLSREEEIKVYKDTTELAELLRD